MSSNIIQTLRERSILSDVTDPAFEELSAKGPVTVYIGFDPTADSLHVGNMMQVMTLKRFQMAGHRPIALVGGGTGMVGDPSGRSSERNLLTREALESNMAGVRKDLARILNFDGPNAAIMLNNADWLATFGFLDFLRDVGKYFRINEMLTKDSVKSRLESDSGLSFTEFSYTLLQAYDFKHLFQHHGCTVQAGGSDQWGNIVAGTDLIRRTLGGQAYGVTTQLLLDGEGKKMGKSVSGAVWMNPEKLAPYEFYQYWVRQPDGDVERFMKMMTLLPLPEISETMAEHAKEPSKHVAQKKLAHAMTSLVHGEEEAARCGKAAVALFSGGGALSGKTDEEMLSLFKDAPSFEVPRTEIEAGIPVADLVVRVGLADSKGAAKRLLEQNGLTLNNGDKPWSKEERAVTTAHLASPSMFLLRAGKKNYCLVKLV